MSPILLLIAVAVTFAIFLTTAPGRELLKRTGFRDRVPGAAPSVDVEYLRSACSGNQTEVDRRLAAEQARYPDLTEAEHYRRAIRKVMTERQHQGHQGQSGGSGGDPPL